MDNSILKTDRQSWDTQAQTWELGWWTRQQEQSKGSCLPLSTAIWSALGFAKDAFAGMTVLDVGCGPTDRLRYFADNIAPGAVWGLDPLFEHYKKLRISHLELYSRWFSVAAEEYLAELESSIDYVVSLNALDHGYDLESALQNIYRYLRPGAGAMISFDCLLEMHNDPTHPIRVFQCDADQLIRDTGFVVDNCDSRPCYPDRTNWGHGQHWHWWLHKPATECSVETPIPHRSIDDYAATGSPAQP